MPRAGAGPAGRGVRHIGKRWGRRRLTGGGGAGPGRPGGQVQCGRCHRGARLRWAGLRPVPTGPCPFPRGRGSVGPGWAWLGRAVPAGGGAGRGGPSCGAAAAVAGGARSPAGAAVPPRTPLGVLARAGQRSPACGAAPRPELPAEGERCPRSGERRSPCAVPRQTRREGPCRCTYPQPCAGPSARPPGRGPGYRHSRRADPSHRTRFLTDVMQPGPGGSVRVSVQAAAGSGCSSFIRPAHPELIWEGVMGARGWLSCFASS